MSELFKLKDIDYNLRGGKRLNSTDIKTVYYGTETISHLAPKIWEQVPEHIKDSSYPDTRHRAKSGTRHRRSSGTRDRRSHPARVTFMAEYVYIYFYFLIFYFCKLCLVL